MSDYFYIDRLDSDMVTIPADEARHLVKVLRKKAGDTVLLTDGKGVRFHGILESTEYDYCTLRIVKSEKDFGKRPYGLHIAIAPTKNLDRIEWFVEKSTEIGIDTITPLICTRSERRELRIDRLQKIAIAAMKQSRQTFLPEILHPIYFNEILKVDEGQRFICHLEESNPLQLVHMVKKGGRFLILIGPEGDFTEDELIRATESGFRCVALGHHRLRTETAGLTACSIISMCNI
ncbi:MAG: RsmE family RNA methyltransferase [Bacteroidota bacterium]